MDMKPDCPKCRREMELLAYLPPEGGLPGVECFRCSPCSEDYTREVEFIATDSTHGRRSAERRDTLKAATIVSDQAASFGCLLRNVSEIGACIETDFETDTPDFFTLVIGNEQMSKACRVAWRAGTRIGVEFDRGALVN